MTRVELSELVLHVIVLFESLFYELGVALDLILELGDLLLLFADHWLQLVALLLLGLRKCSRLLLLLILELDSLR